MPALETKLDGITMFTRNYKRTLAAAITALALSGAATLPAHAHASFLTDLWWKADESGWGASIVQQDDISVITLFVYGPNGEPTWYVAPQARVLGLTNRGLPVVSGTLYKARGPWFGGNYDASKLQMERVGEVSVEPTNTKDAVFRYQIDGTSVAKAVTRQTWRPAYDIEIMNQYAGSLLGTRREIGKATRAVRAHGTVEFTTENNIGAVSFPIGGVRCELVGPIARAGKFASISGDYGCSNGETGRGELSEIEITRNGFNARLSMSTEGASLTANVAGARR
jgi:hypothetical protein